MYERSFSDGVTEPFSPQLTDEDLDTAAQPSLRFAWLEVTGKCQLKCVHCYADSGPDGGHGVMSEGDWEDSIDQLASLKTNAVQFIGGEPLLHPSIQKLTGRALKNSMRVEVYSNLSHVSEPMWDMLSQDGVSLATSYYSPSAAEHESITQGRGSHRRTRENIAKALERDIPLRVGIIGVSASQQVEAAKEELRKLGVERIGVDYLRQVGRGVREDEPSTEQLCGNCGDGVVAILNDGGVQPCVFSRWGEFTIGNVREQSLRNILIGQRAMAVGQALSNAFDERIELSRRKKCSPVNCNPAYPDPCAPECMPNCLPNTGGGEPRCQPKIDGNIISLGCSPDSCAPDDTCNPDLNDGCAPDDNWCEPRTQG